MHTYVSNLWGNSGTVVKFLPLFPCRLPDIRRKNSPNLGLNPTNQIQQTTTLSPYLVLKVLEHDYCGPIPSYPHFVPVEMPGPQSNLTKAEADQDGFGKFR